MNIREWFLSLAPRERLMLGAMAAFIAGVLLYVGVWETLHGGVASMRQRVAQQRQLVGWLHSVAPEIRALRSTTATNTSTGENKSLLTIVNRTSNAAGLGGMLKRIQPRGDDTVQVWVGGANFDDMIGWLYRLKSRHGIRIESIYLNPEDKPGRVHGRIRLTRKP